MDEMNTEDAPFAVDQNYVFQQLKVDLAETREQLLLQKSAFNQVQDMLADRIRQIDSLEAGVTSLRAQIGEHERFAVQQQTTINSHLEFVKLFGFDNFESFSQEFGRMLTMRAEAGE